MPSQYQQHVAARLQHDLERTLRDKKVADEELARTDSHYCYPITISGDPGRLGFLHIASSHDDAGFLLFLLLQLDLIWKSKSPQPIVTVS